MNDWPSKDAQIEAQAETIKALWVEVAHLQKQADRANTLQKMYDDSQDYIKKLKAQLTPEAKAQWVFQEAGHGQAEKA
jgi:hypothetical protein